MKPYIELSAPELIQCIREIMGENKSSLPLQGLDRIDDPQLNFDAVHPIFKEYIQQFKGKSEAPPEYIAAAFLTSLSSAIGNRMILKRGKGVMPNLYVMLVGASTFMRKSTAINIGLKPLKTVDKEIRKKLANENQIYKDLAYEWMSLDRKDRDIFDIPLQPKDSSIFFQIK